MQSIKCSCTGERGRDGTDEIQQICCCDWELKIGYSVAASLAVFEAKRLLVIVLELLVQWNVIRILGGFQPLMLSFIDISLGFFTATGAIFVLRGLRSRFWEPSTKRRLKGLLILIIICVIMNIFTLVSIGYNVSVKEHTIASLFNNSMHYYTINESDKLNVDQIQWDLQCCGHSNYSDWFGLNWRIAQHIPKHDGIGKIDDCSVPFSCCSIKNLGACIHTQMKNEDIRTINNQGCSSILHDIIFKIVFVAYSMGLMLIITQIFVGVCIVRMLMKSFMDFSRCATEMSQHSLLLRAYKEAKNYSCSNGEHPIGKRSKQIQVCMRPRRCRSKTGHHSHHSESSLDSSSDFRAARIKPSIHLEHRVPQKRSSVKSTTR